MTDAEITAFVEQQREWLELEFGANDKESSDKNNSNEDDSSSSSWVIGGLEVASVSVGLYGRTVVVLAAAAACRCDSKDGGGQRSLLPAHRLTVGDEVEIASNRHKKKSGKSGVICQVSHTEISVALFEDHQKHNPSVNHKSVSNKKDDNDNDDDDDMIGPPPLWIRPRSLAVVHQKMMRALEDLQRQGTNHSVAGHIISAIFQPTPTKKNAPAVVAPCPQEATTTPSTTAAAGGSAAGGWESLTFFNQHLDHSQKEAIHFALDEDVPVALIHGPPGTGKTTTLAELIQQAVLRQWKVLVTAPSNVAVDNILERLVVPPPDAPKTTRRSAAKRQKSRLRVVRLGHPARIKPSTLPYSLEALVRAADESQIVQDCRLELASHLKQLSNPSCSWGTAAQRTAQREVRHLRKEIRQREQAVVDQILQQAQVVLATNVGAASLSSSKRQMDGFDVVVMDEAAQALEASCWIPMLQARHKLVLAGDHCQLAPTITSSNPRVQRGLGQTLFQRLMERPPVETSSRMLSVQYRMNQAIANWSSQAMYQGRLQSSDRVKDQTLSQLPHVSLPQEDWNAAFWLIDTTGCADMDESVNAAGSRFNEGEASVVAAHVQALLHTGLKPSEVAVITPYNGQVEVLRRLLLHHDNNDDNCPGLEIRSVDGFQGGEREAIVLSLVRSSSENGIGFLRDARRLNVAITRAKRHCAVICNVETVSQNAFLQGLMTWIPQHGDYRSAMEYVQNNDKITTKSASRQSLSILQSRPKTTKGTKTTETDSKSDGRARNKEEETAAPTSVAEPKPDAVSSKRTDGAEPKLRKEAAAAALPITAKSAASNQEGPANLTKEALLELLERFAEEEEEENVLVLNARRLSSNVHRLVLETAAKELHLDVSMEEPDIRITKRSCPPKNDDYDGVASHGGFAALYDDDDDDVAPQENSLLASLAHERMERERQRQARTAAEAASTTPRAPAATTMGKTSNNNNNDTSKTKTTKKKKKTKKGKPSEEEEEELDDMAFLNAEIARVSNSHGRQVEGSGKQYRSIINGMLNAKPPQSNSQRNEKASSALRTKLQQAEADRRGGKRGKK